MQSSQMLSEMYASVGLSEQVCCLQDSAAQSTQQHITVQYSTLQYSTRHLVQLADTRHQTCQESPKLYAWQAARTRGMNPTLCRQHCTRPHAHTSAVSNTVCTPLCAFPLCTSCVHSLFTGSTQKLQAAPCMPEARVHHSLKPAQQHHPHHGALPQRTRLP